MRDIVAECLRVDGVAKGEEGRELGESFVVEAVEVRKVAALVNLVDVCLLGGEVDVLLDLFADPAQKSVVDQARDDAVFVGGRRGVFRRVFVEHLLVEQALAESGFGFIGAESYGGVRMFGAYRIADMPVSVLFLDRFLIGFLPSAGPAAFLFILGPQLGLLYKNQSVLKGVQCRREKGSFGNGLISKHKISHCESIGWVQNFFKKCPAKDRTTKKHGPPCLPQPSYPLHLPTSILADICMMTEPPSSIRVMPYAPGALLLVYGASS